MDNGNGAVKQHATQKNVNDRHTGKRCHYLGTTQISQRVGATVRETKEFSHEYKSVPGTRAGYKAAPASEEGNNTKK
jgi:hypothetical protein